MYDRLSVEPGKVMGTPVNGGIEVTPDPAKFKQRWNACLGNNDIYSPQNWAQYGFDDSSWTVAGWIDLKTGRQIRLRCGGVRHMMNDTSGRINNKAHDASTNPAAFMKCVTNILEMGSAGSLTRSPQEFKFPYGIGTAGMYVDASSGDPWDDVRTAFTDNLVADDWVGCSLGSR